jgi:exodeoxyribonuclease-5
MKAHPENSLSHDQRAAMDTIGTWIAQRGPHRDHVLGGPAGTGKTFTLKQVLAFADRAGVPVSLTASTNKAAKVLAATTGRDATTVHSTLGIRQQQDVTTGRERFRQAGVSQLVRDGLLIVDEASMIGRDLTEIIANEADKRGCGVLYVGDPYQLPPVGADVSPVFADVASQSILTTIHRQRGDNPLLDLATGFRQVLDGAAFPAGFADAHADDGGHLARGRETWLADMIDAFSAQPFNDNPDRVRALAWTNRRVGELNAILRRQVVGAAPDERFVAGEMVTAGSPIVKPVRIERDGERVWMDEVVLQTDAVATVQRARRIVDEYGVPGWQLKLSDVTTEVFVPDDWATAKSVLNELRTAARQMTDRFNATNNPADDRTRRKAWRAFFDAEKHFSDIRYPYASTVHKAQGSTYQTAFVDVADIGRNTKDRDIARLCYVALTRPSAFAITTGDLPARCRKEAA